MKWGAALATIAGVGLLVWISRQEQARALVADSSAALLEGVADVYYATTQDTRENEERYAPIIADVEAQNGIPAGLLHRLIYQESHFRSDIINGMTESGAGALGIAQIVPSQHPSVDPLDPEGAIRYAGRYLADNYRRFGSWRLALAAYNAGPGNVAKYGGVPPFAETQNYVAAITRDVEVA